MFGQNLSSRVQEEEVNRYPWFAARFWDGMRMGTWWRLLARNHFAMSPGRFPTSSLTFVANPINSVCYRWQEMRWRRQVEKMIIDKPPLFILGHWRAGTTLLHELLVLDSRYGYPTTYDCFAPSHFLSTQQFMTRWFGFLLPERRPMDNMDAGWNRPQEDEFALLNLGAPSIYETVAFPNHGPAGLDSLDFSRFSERQIETWKNTLQWFLQRLFFREQRELVLKSPPHLGRVKVLLEMFPDARFVHIVRDPYAVYPSTLRLWKSLIQTQSVQVPRCEWLPDFVFTAFSRLYTAFEESRSLIPPGQYCEIRYEQLVENPVETVRSIYQKLGIDSFEEMMPRLTSHVADFKDYRTNQYALDETTREQIREKWCDFMERYGYNRN